MKKLLFVLLITPFLSSQAQDCCADQNFPIRLFKNHNTKRVSVTMVRTDTLVKTFLYEHLLTREGDVFENNQYSSNKEYRTETACGWSKDKKLFTKTLSSVDNRGNKIAISRTTKLYDSKKRLIEKSDETLMGNYLRYIYKYNQEDTTETYQEVIAFMGPDSNAHTINKQSSKGFWLISREKKDGKWFVRKQEVLYKNGMVISFDEYENGKLISSRKGLPNEEAYIRKRKKEDDGENPLPYNEFIYIDTIKVKSSEIEPIYFKELNHELAQEPLTKTIQYFNYLKNDVFQIQYYYANGLPAISHNLNLKTFMLYEYEWYE